MARRDYAGHAVQTTVTAQVNPTDLSITLDASTGWPTGGANGEFFITVNPDEVNEERILVASRSGNTLTIANTSKRGVDETSAGTHIAGSVIRHSYAAVEADEANFHINDITHDHHTQYMKADGTRHDLTARHSAGSVVPTAAPIAITPDAVNAEGAGVNLARATHVHGITAVAPVSIGTANSEGVATSFPRSDHVHELGNGSIDSSTLFAAGVVDAAAIAANAVGASELADNAVDTAALVNAAVNIAKIGIEAPTAYSPTFGGFVTPVDPYGFYYKLGRLVVGWAGVLTGTGGVTSSITVSVPFTNTGGFEGVLAARARQPGGTAGGSGIGIIADGTAVGVNITTIGAAEWGNNVPMGWTLNSSLRAVFLYVAAA